jgi:hypothetical protein
VCRLSSSQDTVSQAHGLTHWTAPGTPPAGSALHSEPGGCAARRVHVPDPGRLSSMHCAARQYQASAKTCSHALTVAACRGQTRRLGLGGGGTEGPAVDTRARRVSVDTPAEAEAAEGPVRRGSLQLRPHRRPHSKQLQPVGTAGMQRAQRDGRAREPSQRLPGALGPGRLESRRGIRQS